MGERRRGHSRREFLSGVGGAGVDTAALTPEVARGWVPAAPGAQAGPATQRFGRMFRDPPFADDSPQLQAALMDIAAPGGMLDANDALDRGPVDLIVDPALSANNPDNPTHTAGTTFVGQFMDHDVTFDATSRLAIPAVPRDTRNFRSPAFDLDLVYGLGRFASGQPHSLNARCCATSRGGCRPGNGWPRKMGAPVLAPADLADLSGFGLRLERDTRCSCTSCEKRSSSRADSAWGRSEDASSARSSSDSGNRPGIVPGRRPRLATDRPRCRRARHLPDGRLPDVRRRRPSQPRPVAATRRPAWSRQRHRRVRGQSAAR